MQQGEAGREDKDNRILKIIIPSTPTIYHIERQNLVKQTFIIKMPDKPGVFLTACRIVKGTCANITRASYDKAIDIHTLFLEVEGTESQITMIKKEFGTHGYLSDNTQEKEVKTILIEITISDMPGALIPVLETITRFHITISSLTSQQEKNEQIIKLGLFIDDADNMEAFLCELTKEIPVRVISYDNDGNKLDNTIFYIKFVNEVTRWCPLAKDEIDELIENANRIMQNLAAKKEDPHKSFEYIIRYAEYLMRHKGEGYIPRITKKTAGDCALYAIEPPCGSTTYLIDTPEGIIGVDTGYPCFADDLHKTIISLIPDFDSRRKECILTHMDMDHAGGIELFDRVHMSRRTYDNFADENKGLPDFRERDEVRAPFYRISSLFSGDHRYNLSTMNIIDMVTPDYTKPLSFIGTVHLFGLKFEVYEGAGGHVDGEIVFYERTLRLYFTGDVMVNAGNLTEGQQEFNTIAPYLLTSVNQNSAMSKKERFALSEIADAGGWLICGGHGAPFEFMFKQGT